MLPVTSCEDKAITYFFVLLVGDDGEDDDDDDDGVPECVFRSGRRRLLTFSQLALPGAVPLMAWHPLFHRCPQRAAAAGGAGRHIAAGR